MTIVVDSNGIIVGMFTEEEATIENIAACSNEK